LRVPDRFPEELLPPLPGVLPPLLPPQAVRARLAAASAPTAREKRESFTVRSSKDVCVSSCGMRTFWDFLLTLRTLGRASDVMARAG
jgi:hypothetical protein